MDNTPDKLDTGKLSLIDLFNKVWFSIPSFQRGYVWGKDEISELLDDVMYAYKHNIDKEYFLGTLVLKQNTYDCNCQKYNEYEVLDGQQRLTTLMLIIACIRDLDIIKYNIKIESNTYELPDEGPCTQIYNECRRMLSRRADNIRKIPALNRIKFDIRKDVNKFIDDNVIRDDGTKSIYIKNYKNKEDITIKNIANGITYIHQWFKNIYKNVDYTYYTDLIISDQTNILVDILTNFIKYLLVNTIFIYISSQNLDDAIRVFTSLNNRGIPLTNSDILKAKNISEINESNRDQYAKIWEDIEGQLGLDEFERFLSWIRTIYVKDKARESLLKEFDERVYKAKLLDIGSKTIDALCVYKNAYDDAILLQNNTNIDYCNLINIMNMGLPSTDWIPLILKWYEKFNDVDIFSFTKLLDNKFSADWILQFTPNERIANMNAILVEIDKASSSQDIINNKNIFMYDKKNLINTFRDNIYGRRFARYILLKLEYMLCNKNTLLSLPNTISVEHILPQNPDKNSQWLKDFTQIDHEKWLHKIGNLMLISRRKNTALGNLDFIDKKKKYLSNNVDALPNSVAVISMNTFTLTDLKFRHDDLLQKIDNWY